MSGCCRLCGKIPWERNDLWEGGSLLLLRWLHSSGRLWREMCPHLWNPYVCILICGNQNRAWPTTILAHVLLLYQGHPWQPTKADVFAALLLNYLRPYLTRRIKIMLPEYGISNTILASLSLDEPCCLLFVLKIYLFKFHLAVSW